MKKIGIIGCAGHYGLALESADHRQACAISAVASPADGTSDVSLRQLAANRGIPFYEDWKEMLRSDLDIMVVDNRYDRHAGVASACLQRGFHVYCEKPLATTLDDLDSLREVWQASGRALGGMFNLRCSRWFLGISKAIHDGEIGKVRLIHAQKSYKLGSRPAFFDKRSQYGGMIPWVGIHALDWCLALGGRCRQVSALQSARDNRGHGELEMTAVLQMELENEVFATVTADYLRPEGGARHDDDRIRVTGTRGMIEVIDGIAWLENELPRRTIPLPEAADPFGEFVRAIDGSSANPFAEEALESTRIALLAREAADRHCTLQVN